MAGSFESFAGPSYISSRSADVILSDVRPIKLKLEALRCMNVLLDEFLYRILNTAGSLSTENLKTGLNKLLPTALGKEAVLEAELELKSYWERNTPHTPSSQEFDLQWSFELLRLKCEAYSTMNDTDEDAGVERKLNERMKNAGASDPPHTSLVAPAALYLTAILEHVCQHVLSNVSRVAARDSSRTLATVNDLFIALCEDESTYPMFKTMKVYEQIEVLSVQKPARSHSVKGSVSDRSSLPSRAASPASTSTRLRVSSEASAPAAFAQLGNGRGSHERPRGIKLFGSRSSSDHDRSGTPASFDEEPKTSSSLDLMDEAALQEFDELMRSSATMKVSLTPDRLKSMEVYKQEKRRIKGQEPENDPFLSVGPEVKRAVSARRAQARLVDAITEDDEPSPIKAHPPTPEQMQPSVIIPRTRQTSLHASSVSPVNGMAAPRTRSITISTPQPLGKKRSTGQFKPTAPPAMPQMPPVSILAPKRDNSFTQGPPMQAGRPPRSRRVARNRESMDLDEIMGGNDDEVLSPPKTPSTPASRRDPSKPYISKTARDLIDFLDEGPPMELEPPNVNASMISLDSSKSRSGRLHRMMSKLSLSGSSERLNGRSSTLPDPRRSPNLHTMSPPSSYLPSSLTARNGRPLPAVVVATPPPPPASFAAALAESSSYFGVTEQHEAPESPQASQASSYRSSVLRKAVPAWDSVDETDQPVLTIVAPPAEKRRSSKSSSPLDEFPAVPTTVNVSGQMNGRAARGDTLPGRHENGITTIRSESFPMASPVGSPVGTAPPSPSASTRRSSPRQASLNSVVTTSSRSITHSAPPQVVPVSQAQHYLHQTSLSMSPEPEVTSEPEVVIEHHHHDQTQEAPSASSSVVDAETVEAESVPAVQGPTSGLTFTDAHDLRRLLSVATTADECRLLVDMFLVKSGFPVFTTPDPFVTPVLEAEVKASDIPTPVEEALKIQARNEDMERDLIMHYLGGFDDAIPETEEDTAVSTPTSA